VVIIFEKLNGEVVGVQKGRFMRRTDAAEGVELNFQQRCEPRQERRNILGNEDRQKKGREEGRLIAQEGKDCQRFGGWGVAEAEGKERDI